MNKPIPPPLPHGAKKSNKSLKLWKLKLLVDTAYELGWRTGTPEDTSPYDAERFKHLQDKILRLEQTF